MAVDCSAGMTGGIVDRDGVEEFIQARLDALSDEIKTMCPEVGPRAAAVHLGDVEQRLRLDMAAARMVDEVLHDGEQSAWPPEHTAGYDATPARWAAMPLDQEDEALIQLELNTLAMQLTEREMREESIQLEVQEFEARLRWELSRLRFRKASSSGSAVLTRPRAMMCVGHLLAATGDEATPASASSPGRRHAASSRLAAGMAEEPCANVAAYDLARPRASFAAAQLQRESESINAAGARLCEMARLYQGLREPDTPSPLRGPMLRSSRNPNPMDTLCASLYEGEARNDAMERSPQAPEQAVSLRSAAQRSEQDLGPRKMRAWEEGEVRNEGRKLFKDFASGAVQKSEAKQRDRAASRIIAFWRGAAARRAFRKELKRRAEKAIRKAASRAQTTCSSEFPEPDVQIRRQVESDMMRSSVAAMHLGGSGLDTAVTTDSTQERGMLQGGMSQSFARGCSGSLCGSRSLTTCEESGGAVLARHHSAAFACGAGLDATSGGTVGGTSSVAVAASSGGTVGGASRVGGSASLLRSVEQRALAWAMQSSGDGHQQAGKVARTQQEVATQRFINAKLKEQRVQLQQLIAFGAEGERCYECSRRTVSLQALLTAICQVGNATYEHYNTVEASDQIDVCRKRFLWKVLDGLSGATHMDPQLDALASEVHAQLGKAADVAGVWSS